jgi:LysR family cys regulon transcriptional activator
MKLLQLRHVVAVSRHNNHISKTAEAIHVSQPAISKQIQLLEEELGFNIFERNRNRIVGLTEPGREMIVIAERILGDVDNLNRLGTEITNKDHGTLTVATTHTQARYLLPRVVQKFMQMHPNVQLSLRQGNPTTICEIVQAGEADIAIGTDMMQSFPKLVRYPSITLPKSIIAKVGHPLLRIRKPTLEQIVQYPIITYDPAYSGHWKVIDAFNRVGLKPRIVFAALDSDVSKTYVGLGLGIAVLSSHAFDKAQDRGLVAKDASYLFESSTAYVTLRAKSYLRRFTYDFIRCFDPRLTREVIDKRL